MSTATTVNPLPSFQSSESNLVQARGFPHHDETINTVLQRDDNTRKRAESLYAYMEKTQRQATDAQSSQPVISQIEYHFVPSEYTQLLSAAAANPPVPMEPSEYQRIEFITVNPQDIDDDFDNDSDDDNVEGDDVDHAVSEDTLINLEEGEGGHVNASCGTDLSSLWRDGGFSVSEGIGAEATIDSTNLSDLSHRNPENHNGRLSQDIVDSVWSKLWNYLFMSASKIRNLQRCRNGCTTVNNLAYFKFLSYSLKAAARESQFRAFLAQSVLGCDPHQSITQVRDTLPHLRRDIDRIEIPFVPVNSASGSAGISFLDILYKCAGIMHNHCVPPPSLNPDLDTVLLLIPTRDGLYRHALKYRCGNGALTYCDLALFVVWGVLLLLKRKKFVLVFGEDRRLYPILSLRHGRLLSLCSVDGVFWWPLFSVTAVDSGTGVPIPSIPY